MLAKRLGAQRFAVETLDFPTAPRPDQSLPRGPRRGWALRLRGPSWFRLTQSDRTATDQQLKNLGAEAVELLETPPGSSGVIAAAPAIGWKPILIAPPADYEPSYLKTLPADSLAPVYAVSDGMPFR